MLVSVNMSRNWFCNHSPPGMFPPLDLLLEYWTEHVAIVCQICVLKYGYFTGMLKASRLFVFVVLGALD